eukprot:363330-Chlamydomonas_euryale.AAC.22
MQRLATCYTALPQLQGTACLTFAAPECDDQTERGTSGLSAQRLFIHQVISSPMEIHAMGTGPVSPRLTSRGYFSLPHTLGCNVQRFNTAIMQFGCTDMETYSAPSQLNALKR